MGFMDGSSVTQSMVSNQQIKNSVNQISKEKCITACTSNLSNINIHATGGTIDGDINVTSTCHINGSSCVLKASLSDNIQNKQANTQAALSLQESDPLSAFAGLTGTSTTQDETSNQTTSNNLTNALNSVCQNKSSANTSDVNIQLDDETVKGDVNVEANGTVSNASCNLENIARATVANDQTNKQTESALQGSPILFAILAILAVVVCIIIGLVVVGLGGAAALSATGGSM